MNREAKKAATRARLVETALRLFAEQGYDETTVQQITTESDVAKGTFFNYFQTKEDVLLEMTQSQVDWAVERLEQLVKEPGLLAPRLTELMVEMAERLQLTPSMARALFRVAMATPEQRNHQLDRNNALTQAITPVVTRGQSKAEFTSGMNATWFAMQMVQTYYGTLWSWAIADGEVPLARWVKGSFDLLFHGAIRRTF